VAAKKYQMVRLEAKTWEMLQELKTAMEVSNIEGSTTYPAHDQFGISLDTVVRTLLERDSAWKRRKKDSAARKRSGVRFTAEGGIRPARLQNVDPGEPLYTVDDQDEQGETEEG